ncbi:MAG TPA: hypothetical protein VFV99_17680 [Kofleriaceae bacterium]|nr:hypothetical protein [Kofleriaceae bacterium]
MKRVFVIALLCLAVGRYHAASAGPRQVLVLKSEGTADASSRTTIDTHVLRIAKNIDGNVVAGDITLTEAAALVGCSSSEAACKDQVLDTLGVDEVVASTVTATPTGLNVTVRRIAKGTPPKAAQTTIPSGKTPDAKLNADIGPLFGLTAPAVVEPPVTAPPVTAPPPPPPPTTTPTTTSPTTTPATTTPTTPPRPVTADASTAPMNDVTAAPNGVVTQQSEGVPRRRWQKIGMGVGGGLVLLGFVMWAQAASVQGQIDDKPEPVSPRDFQDLRDLEKKGDDLASGGNFFFVVGALVGGVSTYYYVKAGRHRPQTARITPMAVPGGAGVTLTLGGAP